jgi:outer membrane translocation and assembly module TamA
MIIPSEDGTGLPIDLRFFNGGASTVRSFPERELGPKASNGDPSGGEAYWAANLEYMHTIAGPVQAVVFYDAGAINPSFADFGGGDVKNAIGAGIRLNLPIGPVRFEYGHALNPADGDPNGAFHFAIGTAF